MCGHTLPQIPLVMQEHQGRYRCEISSDTERMWSSEVDVMIGTHVMLCKVLPVYRSLNTVGSFYFCVLSTREKVQANDGSYDNVL